MLFFVISSVLLLAGIVIWQIRGRNSPPISASGGDFFAGFLTIDTPFYLQGDERWRDEQIGGTGEKLAKVGCTVCSLAMALNYYGLHFTPKELNDLLKENSGYTWRGWLKWNAISEISKRKVSIDVIARPTHATIDTALRKRQPVLAKVLIHHLVPHWVLIVGKDGTEYLIRDTLGDGKKTDRLAIYRSDIYGLRVVRLTAP